ncbi:MAG: carbon-nitrogen hydrolase family protein [Bythopirellula sp.]
MPTNRTSTRINRQFMLLAVVVLTPVIHKQPLAAAEAGETSSSNFVVAAMRVQPKRWDKQHNFKLLQEYATHAARKGADLVVTCEGFLDGYTGNAKLSPGLTREKYFQVGESVDGPLLQRITNLAADLKIHIAVGFAERRNDRMYNSVVVISPSGEILLHYSKTHTKGETFNTPGTHFPVAQTSLGTLGALICYDRRFPEVPRILALKGAQVLILPAYGTDGERNEALLRTRAWENSVWVVYVKQNQALIIKPSGKILARDQGDQDQLVLATIEIDDNVGTGDILERRNPQVYRELIEFQTEDKP